MRVRTPSLASCLYTTGLYHFSLNGSFGFGGGQVAIAGNLRFETPSYLSHFGYDGILISGTFDVYGSSGMESYGPIRCGLLRLNGPSVMISLQFTDANFGGISGAGSLQLHAFLPDPKQAVVTITGPVNIEGHILLSRINMVSAYDVQTGFSILRSSNVTMIGSGKLIFTSYMSSDTGLNVLNINE